MSLPVFEAKPDVDNDTREQMLLASTASEIGELVERRETGWITPDNGDTLMYIVDGQSKGIIESTEDGNFIVSIRESRIEYTTLRAAVLAIEKGDEND